jgi:hypothetical protein
MRFISLLLFLTLSFSAFSAETPEAIPLKTKIIRPHEWYAQQFQLWRNELTLKPSEEGWLHYYTAARYSQMKEDVLNSIEKEVNAVFPNSFAANVIKGWNRGFSSQGYEYLMKANEIQPNHPLINALAAMHHEYNMDRDKRTVAVKKLWQNNGISNSLLHYTYNVLMSVETDAVLFTEGENTTLPILLLQDVFGIRKDVQVLNLDLLLETSYRNRKLQDAGLELTEKIDGGPSVESKRLLCESLPSQNSTRKFYYSLTVGQQNISGIKDQLYVVGLASQISRERVDNISLIRENLENRFLLDNLTVDFNGESDFASGKVLSANYLVPMLLLYEHYVKMGETEKIKYWDAVITRLANEKGKALLVRNYLNRENSNPLPFVPAKLNVKAIEGHLRVVKGNIYAFESELTNMDYNIFLNYLLDNKRTDLYEKSKFDLSQYDEPALSFMKTYHANPAITKKNKYFTNYPVVNISYEGALAFCEWLTEQYNNLPDRKYKKVKFRLPSIKEWQIAALGYKNFQSWNIEENTVELNIPKNSTDEICKNCATKTVSFKESGILYPWYISYNYRNKALNSRGCALGNFKWPDNHEVCRPQMPTPDGWTLMAPVESYFPNNIGLYDVVGNVAEMISEKGKACGGSWNHPAEESTILSISEYKGPDSAVGFRPFMEVIEQ